METINNNSIQHVNESLTPNDIRVEKEWYENGCLKCATTYKGGEKDGEQKEWYPNGQLKSRCNYNNGLLDGISKKWHSNGQPYSEINHKEGWQEGLARW